MLYFVQKKWRKPMADQNLHDIKIDELDSPKKTSLKNILTLVALLFIIFAISVVITQLILNTDDNKELLDTNSSKEALLNDETETDSSDSQENSKNELNTTTIPTLNPIIKERNITSSIKTPLTTNEPTKLRTYDSPKKSAEVEPKMVVKKNPEPKKVKKEYIEDKVIVKKQPKAPATQAESVLKKSYLGGQQMAVSNSYYIKVGTYRDTSKVVQKIKQNNFNYSLVKVENDTTLTRVFIGPFFSRNQAGSELDKVKANILAGAYITKKAK
jgi:cell division septation protein DedD